MINNGKTQEEKWITPKNVLAVFQILAILGAACWTIFLFFQFDAKEKELSLALLESQNLQSRISAQLSTLQLEKSEHELASLKSARIAFDQEIEIEDLGLFEGENEKDHIFLVSYDYSIRNQGNSRNEVTYVLVHAFSLPLKIPKNVRAVELPTFRKKGKLTWVPLFSKGFYYGPKWQETMLFKAVSGETLGFEKGGGGTSELDAGEGSVGSIELLVRAKINDFIGFETRIGLNGGETPDDRWKLIRRVCLSEGTDGSQLRGGLL